MSLHADEIARLVAEECARASYIPLAEAISPFLVPPRSRQLRWPYSAERVEFPCWIVADFGEKKDRLMLAYSEYGHGARGDCWGIVRAEDDSFGRDDSWFLRLEDAFIGAGAWSGSLPPEYEVR